MKNKFTQSKKAWARTADGITDQEEVGYRVTENISYIKECHIITRGDQTPLFMGTEETGPCWFVGIKGYLICPLEYRAEFRPTWRELWRLLLIKVGFSAPTWAKKYRGHVIFGNKGMPPHKDKE